MTSTTVSPDAPARGRTIPSTANRFDRQVVVELLKTVDTRSGRTLMIITAAMVVVVLAVQVAMTTQIPELELGFGDLALGAGTATAMLLPVLGILLVTSEWSQRTTLITFVLEPRRGQVLGAKLVAGVIIAVAAMIVAVAVAALATPLPALIGNASVDWSISMHSLIGFVAQQVIAVISGMALAMLILNTPAAIVAYVGYALLLPMLLPLLSLWQPASKIVGWIDFSGAQQALTSTMNATDWGHLVVSGAIWLVLPMALGALRILRSDIS